MVELLMIADDMTGALDSGIALVKMGISTEVLTDPQRGLQQIAGEHRAVVINTATRHVDPEEAYRIVFQICSQAVQIGIPVIYKKTDSVMRGNIGAELEAALAASGENVLYFAPAYPKLKRFTRAGVQYVGDVPIHQSSFASDILNPITDSYIPDIIARQSRIPVLQQELPSGEKYIRLFDSETDEDLLSAAELALQKKTAVLSGCAGFAGAVAQVMQRQGNARPFRLQPPLAVLCGSVHPTSKAQLNHAVAQGLQRFWIVSQEIIEDEYWEKPEGIRFLGELKQCFDEDMTVLIETAYEEEPDLPAEQCGEIAKKLPYAIGNLAVKLLEAGFSGTLMIFGGDSLGGFIKAMDAPGIEPLVELSPGVVLSRANWKGKQIQFITKAGSFGNQNLILEVEDLIRRQCQKEGIL